MNISTKFTQLSSSLGLRSCTQCLQRRLWSNIRKRISREEAVEGTIYQYGTAKRTDRVYIWGYAATGALGVQTFLRPEKNKSAKKIQHSPHRLSFMDNRLKVKNVACGYGFTVFICDSPYGHQLYGTGINTDSQLGYHQYPSRSGKTLDYIIQPQHMELPLLSKSKTKLTHVACGRAHTVVVTDNEGVFSFGNNALGQCGRGIVEGEQYRGSQLINRVSIDGPIKQVVCGQDHTLFLMESGDVYSCGWGADGQTGLGHHNSQGYPTRVQGDIGGEKIVQVKSRADSVLAINDKGEVFGWGNSEYGQLSLVTDSCQEGVPRHLAFPDIGRVVSVASGGSSCALVNDEGQVYTWGYGLLGKGPKLVQSDRPSLIPETLFGQSVFNPDTKVVNIQSGINYMAAVTNSGDLYVWGRNKTGCLGLGHKLDQYFPFKVALSAEVKSVSCGVDHTVAMCKAFV